MRIAVLSDFHIGATDATDSFAHREDDFLSYLDELEGDHDIVVLLGDIFQTEHGFLPDRPTARLQLAMARARVPGLCERMTGASYRYIHGNHDEIASSVMSAPSSLQLGDDEFSVFLIHGHQFDPMLRMPIYPISRTATWFTGRLRQYGLRTVAEYFEGRDIVIKHERLGGPDGPYARASRDLMRQHKADCVVMGHTHMPVCHEFAEGISVNTGTCSHGQRCHVSIDTRARTVDVIRSV